MNTLRQIGPRSSLFSHSFPTFYACYLLKSIQKPKSTSRKKDKGQKALADANDSIRLSVALDSPQAALQFEWAWQHPHKSRHLQNGGPAAAKAGSSKSIAIAQKPRNVKANVQAVRLMICSHPYNTWPLHIKLFTEEAVKAWTEADSVPGAVPLPPGFTYQIELEGVDGKSGLKGSGRRGPIDVQDEIFTSEHLEKNRIILNSDQPPCCSVCNEPVTNYASDPAEAALCPSRNCTSVSHLSCLATQFRTQSNSQTLIPRGGTCHSCNNYVLWGDIIRGAFRRKAGRVVSEPDNEDAADDEAGLYESDSELDNVVTSTLGSPLLKTKTRRSRSRSSASSTSSNGSKPTRRARSKSGSSTSSNDMEVDQISIYSSGSDVELASTPRKRGRPRKSPVQEQLLPANSQATVPTTNGVVAPRTRGRPRKSPAPAPVGVFDSVRAVAPRGHGRPPKNTQSTPVGVFDNVVIRRGRGRPPKTPEPTLSDVSDNSVIRRGRGRPPKAPEPTLSDASDNSAIRRGRGRPPKTPDPTLSDVSDNSVIRRGRGRPRKTPEPTLSDVSGDSVIRRGRGRPRKTPEPRLSDVSDNVDIRRRPGRPPKNPTTASLVPAGKATKRKPGTKRTYTTQSRAPESDSSGEHFGFSGISDSSSDEAPSSAPNAPTGKRLAHVMSTLAALSIGV